MRHYVKLKRGQNAPKWEGCTWRRLKDLEPIFARTIASIHPREVGDILEKISLDRNAKEMARRVASLVRAIFDLAVSRGDIEGGAHQMGGLGKQLPMPSRKKRRPAVPVSELPALLRAVDSYDQEPTRAALKLAFLTVLRASELLAARWDWIEGDVLTVPPEFMKMKRPHNVPLTRQALAVVAELKARGHSSPFLFPSPDKLGKALSTNALLFAFYRMGYKTKQSTHGIRALFSTVANEAREAGSHDFSAELVEVQLAHTLGKVRAAYARVDYLEARRALLQWWSDHLDALRGQA